MREIDHAMGWGEEKQKLILSFKADKMDFITTCHCRIKRYQV